MMVTHDLGRGGVARWPIAHSLSPLIHGYWLSEFGIVGGYEQFAVRLGEFAEFAAGIGGGELFGSNDTVPHKAAALFACARRTRVAEPLGAVNTLWHEGGLLLGDYTDVEGFLTNIDESAAGWAEGAESAFVIGAGTRAVIYALTSGGFRRFAILNRTDARAVAIAAEFGGAAVAVTWTDLITALSDADLLVSASSLGMAGEPALKVDLAVLPKSAVVADIFCVPLGTALVADAGARGLRASGGLGMLLHYVVPAFARWFGRRPKIAPSLRALVEADVLARHEDMR